MMDIHAIQTAEQLNFYSDVSAAAGLGMGATFDDEWCYTQWESGYIKKLKPNIEYLELYALVAAILMWEKNPKLSNTRIILYCDNSAVVQMVNSLMSGCKNCMYLIQLLTLDNLIHNRRVFAKHLHSEQNYLSDALSRMQFKRFWRLAPPSIKKTPTPLSDKVWPASKIWNQLDN